MTSDVQSPAEPKGSVQIPGIIVQFLNHATVGVAGTRDANLVPRVRRVSGWRVEPDQETIACTIPEAFLPGLLESLRDNGEFALTVEEIGPHETYQFKGTFVDAGLCTEADLKAFEGLRDRFGTVVTSLYGIPEKACRAYVRKPSLTVRFRVREIFVQTPGPGAGRRLVPPEAK
jgi:hypothetical protein